MAEIKPIDDLRAGLTGLLTVQAARVLLHRSLPRHGHRQQQCVEWWMVEPLTDQSPGGQHDAGRLRRQGLQRGQGGAALPCAQAAMQQEQVRYLPSQSGSDRRDVVGALTQQQQFSAFLPGLQRFDHNPIRALLS